MTKLAASHLPHLAQAFDAALQSGAVTVVQAREFCDATFNATLDQQVRDGKTGNNAERVRPAQPPATDAASDVAASAADGGATSAQGDEPGRAEKGHRRRR